MARDLPIEEHVFHLRPLPDVVDDHVTSAQVIFLVDDYADMRHIPA